MEETMFDIRKIQENIIYEAVRAESNEDIANEVVYGKDNMSKAENNSDWVKSSMIRLENNFETETIKKIRMKNLQIQRKQKKLGFFVKTENFFCNLIFALVQCFPKWIN